MKFHFKKLLTFQVEIIRSIATNLNGLGHLQSYQ
jgi:hypothetical protein